MDKKRPSLKEVVNEVPPVSASYEAVHVDERSAILTVIGSENMPPLQFFELYCTSVLSIWRQLLGIHI